jgi:imidazolonepropionase-like amidohydrolase
MKRALLIAALSVCTLEAKAASLAVVNAEVHTVSRAGVLPKATVLIRDDRIDAVGTKVALPSDARVIDAAGRPVTPGLFDAYSNLGLKEIDGVDQTVDVADKLPRFSAALDVLDALNLRSTLIPVTRIDGVTRALSAPESREGGSLISGQGAVISLDAGADAITLPHAAMFAQLGEAGARLAGGARTASFASLREAFEEVRQSGASHSFGATFRESQLGLLDVEALKPVLSGEMPLVLAVNRAADIQAALRLADDYRLRLIIRGGAEAYQLAAALAEKQVPVILDPLDNLPAHFEMLGVRNDNAARLAAAGVRIAIAPMDSDGTHNARNLRQAAGNAAAWGLDRERALAAITLEPAAIYGLDRSLGSVEPGKIADLVIWDGDPLEVTTAATAVFINGKAIPMLSRQTLLRDRYLRRLHAQP